MINFNQYFVAPIEYECQPISFSNTCCTESSNQKNNQLSNKYQVKHRTRLPFSLKEDLLLLKLVKQFETDNNINWYFIANQIEGRSVRQCRERYQLFLSDGIKRKVKWTKEEDELLLAKYSIFGPKWKKMEEFFVGRTSYSIKNRFISLEKERKKNELIIAQARCIQPPTIIVRRYYIPSKFKNVTLHNINGKI